jgi:hypothetical protein
LAQVIGTIQLLVGLSGASAYTMINSARIFAMI